MKTVSEFLSPVPTLLSLPRVQEHLEEWLLACTVQFRLACIPGLPGLHPASSHPGAWLWTPAPPWEGPPSFPSLCPRPSQSPPQPTL